MTPSRQRVAAALVALGLFVSACGGGSGSGGSASVTGDGGCTGGCAAATPISLSIAEVQQVLAQAIREAQARAAPATIAVVDRAGNVLAVFRMTGGP